MVIKKEDGHTVNILFFSVGMSASETTGQLVSTPFKQWKKATERFDNYETLEYHKASLLCLNNFLESMSGKSVRIALRGHRDSGPFEVNEEPPQNEGNFRALLRFRIDASDQNLRDHLTGSSRNAVYTSWKIQNEIIDSCATIIKRKIANEVNVAKVFSVLADETLDISNIEQFTLCVRYLKEDTNLKEYKICENFLQFTPVENTTGVNLAETIIRNLQDCNIEVEYLRGYDGTSSMSGKFNGAQAKILEKYPTAIYVQCVSHCLNLAISNSVEVPAIRNTLRIVTEMSLYNFFNYPKRQIVLQKYISQSENVQIQSAKLNSFAQLVGWIDRISF
ncbi:hypothetical protein NQ314_014687 [Rhamnusium bicolor]|uniref:DUF4371 domain-containing protein n=1 Tax=Rhamnusium bicolor TaxID=1586634 RepID=A0AAV8X1L2_9CUCU|nr:hypothetical protein NQ314_014687 [Rhamnusium bicolor]